MVSVCVFCGSQAGTDPAHLQAARELGADLAQAGHRLIYGGGSTGMMGAIADSVLEHEGTVIGVIPEALANIELMHPRVADMRIVPDMHVRKAAMHALADCYVALPGGFGTMEELFEALCWAQLDFHSAPIALLNIAGIYDGLVRLVDDMIDHGFLNSDHRKLLSTMTSVNEVTDWLREIS